MQIISDSMSKYVTDIRHTEVLTFLGINVNRLSNKIRTGNLILDKTFTIIHVGTDDVASMDVGSISSSYNDLISLIKQRSNTKIVVSSILPRPVDHLVSGIKLLL